MLRHIDNLCVLLIRKLCGTTSIIDTVMPRKKSKSNCCDILVFRSAALGDFLMSIPAMKLLRKAYPKRRIVFITISSSMRDLRNQVKQYSGDHDKAPWVKLAGDLVDETIVLEDLGFFSLLSYRKKIRKLAFERSYILNDPSAPLSGRLKKIILVRFLGVTGPIFGCNDSQIRRNLPGINAEGFC